jgi:hypothetical protein
MLLTRRSLRKSQIAHQHSEQARKEGNVKLADELERESRYQLRKTFVLGRATARILKNKLHLTTNQRRLVHDGEKLYRAMSKEVRKKQRKQ